MLLKIAMIIVLRAEFACAAVIVESGHTSSPAFSHNVRGSVYLWGSPSLSMTHVWEARKRERVGNGGGLQPSVGVRHVIKGHSHITIFPLTLRRHSH